MSTKAMPNREENESATQAMALHGRQRERDPPLDGSRLQIVNTGPVRLSRRFPSKVPLLYCSWWVTRGLALCALRPLW